MTPRKCFYPKCEVGTGLSDLPVRERAYHAGRDQVVLVLDLGQQRFPALQP
jgi:hypothetical protein